jgi:hypothetical protein
LIHASFFQEVFGKVTEFLRYDTWSVFPDAKTAEGDKGSSDERVVKTEGDKNSVSAFGSITAQLIDGMTLSLSQFGASGESKDGKLILNDLFYSGHCKCKLLAILN